MQPAFEELGAQIIEPDLFMDELMGDFEKELIPSIREAIEAAYRDLLDRRRNSFLGRFFIEVAKVRLCLREGCPRPL